MTVVDTAITDGPATLMTINRPAMPRKDKSNAINETPGVSHSRAGHQLKPDVPLFFLATGLGVSEGVECRGADQSQQKQKLETGGEARAGADDFKVSQVNFFECWEESNHATRWRETWERKAKKANVAS